jgi:hypothetical protein
MSRQTKQADPLEPERHQCARVEVSSNHSRDRGSTMNVTTYGLDLARRFFRPRTSSPAGEATIYPYLLETIVIDRPKQGQAQQAWVLRRVLVASSKPSRPDDRGL